MLGLQAPPVQLPLIQQINPLSDVVSWLVYRHPETGERTSEVWNVQSQLQPTTHRYLESEFWWDISLPIGALMPLSEDYAYVYRLRTMASFPEYWLLWTDHALNAEQQKQIQKQGGLLQQSLDLWQVVCQQQQTIQQLQQSLQRAQHQLHNPLALIGLYSENLRRSLHNDPRQAEAQVICETATDLSQHLRDLLACGSQSTAQLIEYDLRSVVIDSLKLLSPLQAERQVEVVYPEQPARLNIDPWRMQQVLENLLSNALHFSPIGGRITLNWEMFQHEMLITIQDQGPGLSNLDIGHLFTPGYSRRGGGQGLGLSIAKQMVLEHQGQIWAENLPRGGTQFSIALPRGCSGLSGSV